MSEPSKRRSLLRVFEDLLGPPVVAGPLAVLLLLAGWQLVRMVAAILAR